MLRAFSSPKASHFQALASALILLFSVTVEAQSKLEEFGKLESIGLLLVDAQGTPLLAANPERGMIPASTTKLLTSWLALQHWGEQHRFDTELFFDIEQKTLWVKAGGDPFLVSEELRLIAAKVRESGIQTIDRIALDVGLFEADLQVPGATTSNNPYDAVPTALAANFNTLNLKREGGKVISAEEQTPLTAFALSFADEIRDETLRINTGQRSQLAQRYFAELLAEFLRQESISVAKTISWGQAPSLDTLLVHRNTRTLGEIVQLMLKYSTNFIANQMMLTLVAEVYNQPANFKLVKQYSVKTLREKFAWQNFDMREGAGLSRHNTLSPKQLIDVLRALLPWQHLLPEIDAGVHAKTGTLDGVSTLAGYLINQKHQQPRLFAIMINETTDASMTREVAKELLTADPLPNTLK